MLTGSKTTFKVRQMLPDIKVRSQRSGTALLFTDTGFGFLILSFVTARFPSSVFLTLTTELFYTCFGLAPAACSFSMNGARNYRLDL